MNFKIIVVMTILAIVSISFFLFSDNTVEQPSFSYDSNFQIQSELESYGIIMSNPLRISGDAISEHCVFFDNPLQNQIKYCTSTELRDSDGKFLGNIHIVGGADTANMALAVIQSDPFVSEESEITYVMDGMIDVLVCRCWEEKRPGGFATVSDWIDAAKTHHLEAKKTTSKSEIHGLAQKDILLEITTNSEGYLWKMLVSKQS